MNLSEFSTEFDILYNNIMSNMAPAVGSYEKSVFLTQAQEMTVISVYNNAFEKVEATREAISSLVAQSPAIHAITEERNGLSSKSKFFKLPLDVWYITSEYAILKDGGFTLDTEGNEIETLRIADVIPTTQDKYSRTMKDPFRRPNSTRVLKLTNANNESELVSDHEIVSYTVRYLKKPSPIVLEDLSDLDITIDGVSEPTECALGNTIHRTILGQAVQLAKTVWMSGNANNNNNSNAK